VDALHREGIRAPIYISVQCDEYAANTHPDWIARTPEGKNVGPAPLQPGWQIVDMSSPYQEYLADQTAEVLKLFHPVDGIFFDMCWDQPSVSKWAKAGMAKLGLNPEVEADRSRYARHVALAYLKRFYRQVKASSPAATVFFNCRPFFNLAEDIAFQTQVEIEALPTGGWGYIYFPKNVRYARTFAKPYMGMTARFHKSWADFGGLKPSPALEYETSQMIAHGARCSIGDQLHPRGTLDRGAYELIGHAYERVAQREPWLDGAVPVAQIGLFQLPTGVLSTTQSTSGTDEGATRMLTQLKHQFDIVSEVTDLRRYELVILPDALPVTPALAKKLRAYVKQGGAILATGTSGLGLPELGVKHIGPSPFTATYIRFGDAINTGVPDSDHVMYERGQRVVPGKGTEILAGIVEPYFERTWNHFCSHKQTPGDKLSPYPAAVQKGRCAYIAFPIFAAYAAHGNYPYRLLVANILQRLLPDPLLCVAAPTSTEATVMRQGKRTIVHLLQYCPERRATNLDLIEDVVPLFNVPVSLRLARAPKEVYLAPTREPVAFSYRQGRCDVTVPEVRGHAMLVFEWV
jgi:hypothetical protein